MALLRGALVEYGSGLMGPIPNVVIFQFNPEQMSRSLKPPARPSGATARETTQAGERTVESISFKAHFSATDRLSEDMDNPMTILARTLGVGPQLAALERMIHPSKKLAGLLGAAVDAVGSLLGAGGKKDGPAQPVPRESYPKILFIWGLTRVLPVTLETLQINEVEFDFILNPVRAEVDLSLTVNEADPCSEDSLAKGALAYSTTAKDAMAAANLANSAQQIMEIIPF